MSDSLMHTTCLLCGKHAVSVPWHLEGLPYENYSYCPDCIHKAMKLLKHKSMTATWWEQNQEDSNKPRLIGCSRCGRTWCVSPNVPYEEWIAERHYCENCGSYMEEGRGENMIELKPCPFCGGKAVRMIFDPDGAPSGVYCNQCRAFVRWNIETAKHEQFGVAMEKYVEKWNRRCSDEAD